MGGREGCYVGKKFPKKGKWGGDKETYFSLSLSGLKVPTTITLTLRGQPSRISTLSPVGPGAPPAEPTPQALPSSSQVRVPGEMGDSPWHGDLSALGLQAD